MTKNDIDFMIRSNKVFGRASDDWIWSKYFTELHFNKAQLDVGEDVCAVCYSTHYVASWRGPSN